MPLLVQARHDRADIGASHADAIRDFVEANGAPARLLAGEEEDDVRGGRAVLRKLGSVHVRAECNEWTVHRTSEITADRAIGLP